MEKNSRERLKIEVRKFALSFGGGLSLLTTLGLWKAWPLGILITTAALGVYHLGLAFFVTKPLLPTFYTITTLGKIVGNVLFTSVFTLVYYLLYTPFSWILKLARKDHIAQGSKKPQWEDFPPTANNPKRIEKLY